MCTASLPCDRYAHPSQYGQQYDGYTSYPPQQPYGHSYDQAAGYEGGPSGAYDPAYGQQPAYVSALPHERQHELLKSLQVGLDAQLRTRLSAPPCGDALRSNARPSRPLQLTRDFLRALPSVPHLLSHTTGFFVRLNMGSRYFLSRWNMFGSISSSGNAPVSMTEMGLNARSMDSTEGASFIKFFGSMVM